MDAARKFWLAGVLLVGLTVAAHLRGVGGQFVQWDDNSHITQNVVIRALTFDNVRTMFTTGIAKLYCPLTWLSFAVDYQISGRDPLGYHVTNLLLHVANTLLVAWLLFRVTQNFPAAVLTAAIFGVHPLRVESVAWVTERKDVLFVFFYLLALLRYRTWVEAKRRGDYWWCLVFFFGAIFSKSAAVTLPAVLILLDWFVYRRQAWVEKIPFLIGSVLIAAATVATQAGGDGETVVSTAVIPMWARSGLVGYCALFYVGKFLWPFQLSAIYPTFEEMEWKMLDAAGWLLALVAVTGLVWVLRRRVPVLLPAWLFYLITLSPTIGLIPVGAHVVADRFSYLPLIGLALPVGLALVKWPKIGWVGAFLILGLVFVSDRRCAVWYDSEKLFQDVLRQYPDSYPALVNLTWWYSGNGRLDEAIAIGERAVKVAPNGLVGRTHLARAYIRAKRYRDAIAVLKPAIDHGINVHYVWHQLHECFTALGDEANARRMELKMKQTPPAPGR